MERLPLFKQEVSPSYPQFEIKQGGGRARNSALSNRVYIGRLWENIF